MDELVHKALEVVALRKRLCVVDATGEVGNVKTSEGVGCASVAANVEDLWKLGCVVENVGVEVRNGVFITNGTLVPIVRDSLMTGVVSKASRLARDGEEALQHLLVEDALGMFSRLVSHEAIDEGEGSL